MKKIALLLSSVLGLTACATTPIVYTASQEEINTYFEQQIIKPQNGFLTHATFGKVAATNEQYMADYNQCLDDAFAGQSFSFGELEVSDPQQLMQYSHDRLMYQLEFLFQRKDALTIKPIFEDKAFKPVDDKISDRLGETLTCVKGKGWTYLSSKKTEQ